MRPLIRQSLAMLCLALGACSTLSQTGAPERAAPTKPAQSQQKAPERTQVPLSELSPDFLYLAGEDAIEHGRVDLAVRFLEALVAKDPEAVVPRIQLGGLLLHQEKGKAALKQLEAALKHEKELAPAIADNAHLLYARALVATGQKERAVNQLKGLLAQNPDRLHIRLMEARLLADTGNLDDALQVIHQGVKRKDAPALRQLQAEIYIRQNKLKQAEAVLKQMRKLAPDSQVAVLMQSQLAIRQHDSVKAEYILRSFLAANPSALRIGNALGRLMVQENRTKEAIQIYKGIAAKTGDNPGVLSALGLLYYKEKMYKQAVSTFEQILEKNPDAPVRFYLAASFEANGQDDRAARIYAQISSDDQDYPAAQLQLAGMEFRADKRDTAANRLLALIKTYPMLSDAYNMLSSIRVSQKRYTLLLKESEPALTLKQVPNNLLFNRAVAFEELKQYDDAEQSLRLIISRDPNHTEALNFLGYMYAEQGIKLEEAESLVQRALEKKPDDPYYLDSLAWVYYKRADYAHALKVQQKAVSKEPKDATMQEHLGDILWESGQDDAAKKAWSRAIGLSHDKKEKARLKQKLTKGL